MRSLIACMEEELEQSQVELDRSYYCMKKGYDPENATRQEEAKMYRFPYCRRGFASSEISRVLRDPDTTWRLIFVELGLR